jgi:predicted acyltransferase (DUF342 family)
VISDQIPSIVDLTRLKHATLSAPIEKSYIIAGDEQSICSIQNSLLDANGSNSSFFALKNVGIKAIGNNNNFYNPVNTHALVSENTTQSVYGSIEDSSFTLKPESNLEVYRNNPAYDLYFNGAKIENNISKIGGFEDITKLYINTDHKNKSTYISIVEDI